MKTTTNAHSRIARTHGNTGAVRARFRKVKSHRSYVFFVFFLSPCVRMCVLANILHIAAFCVDPAEHSAGGVWRPSASDAVPVAHLSASALACVQKRNFGRCDACNIVNDQSRQNNNNSA